jgi:hypothetical protein
MKGGIKMRNTQTLEIKDIGEVKLYPIKVARQEFKPINESGEELKSKRIGEASHLIYVDKAEKEYEKENIFYLVGKNKVQKILRTEKVNAFKIVDKMEVFDFLAEDYAILDYSETTLKNFEREIGDKAIKFVIKKSSTGFKFDIAYIFKFQNRLIMYSGFGLISEGLKNFNLMKQTEKVSKTIKDTIEIKCEDLDIIQL